MLTCRKNRLWQNMTESLEPYRPPRTKLANLKEFEEIVDSEVGLEALHAVLR